MNNIETMRSIPQILPVPNREAPIPALKGNILSRTVRVAFEALPLLSLINSSAGRFGTLCAMGFKVGASLSDIATNSSSTSLKNRIGTAVVVSTQAASFMVLPSITTRVMHCWSAAQNLFDAAKSLSKGNVSEAGKSAAKSLYDITFIAVLATANPQLIVISLVAQAAFHLHRAYQYKCEGMMVEAVINTVTAGVSGGMVYNRRNDLIVPISKYTAAVKEAGVAFKRQAEAIYLNTVQMIKGLYSAIHFDDVEVKGLHDENEYTLFNFYQYVMEDLAKIYSTLENTDYYLSKREFDETVAEMHETLHYAKMILSHSKYAQLESKAIQIKNHLQKHIR